MKPEPIYVNIDRVKALAREQGRTLSYLCACVGKYRSFLSAVRLGSDRIDEGQLLIIADKLGTTVDYLTDRTDRPGLPTPEQECEQLGAEKARLLADIRKLPPEAVERVQHYLDFLRWEKERRA